MRFDRNVHSGICNRRNRKLFLLPTLVLMGTLSLGNILDGEVKFDAFDGGDVDALIAAHSSLAAAMNSISDTLKTFLDMPLSRAVERVSDRFHDGLQCLASSATAQAEISMKRAFPNWELLKSKSELACKNATVVPFGQGGVSDNFLFVDCLIRQQVDERHYSLAQLVSAYAGLNGIAASEVCMHREKSESAGYQIAKKDFGYSGVRARLWADVSSLEGCKSTEVARACIRKYVNDKVAELNAYLPIDRPIEVRDSAVLLSLIDKLKAPGVLNTNFRFSLNDGIPPEVFRAYEKAGVSAIRAVELAEFSQAKRAMGMKEKTDAWTSQANAIDRTCSLHSFVPSPEFNQRRAQAVQIVDSCEATEKEEMMNRTFGDIKVPSGTTYIGGSCNGLREVRERWGAAHSDCVTEGNRARARAEALARAMRRIRRGF